jgi:hypothetical protein
MLIKLTYFTNFLILLVYAFIYHKFNIKFIQPLNIFLYKLLYNAHKNNYRIDNIE